MNMNPSIIKLLQGIDGLVMYYPASGKVRV